MMNNDNNEYRLKKLLSEVFLLANSNHLNIESFVNSYLNSKQFHIVLENYEEYYFNAYKEYSNFMKNNNFKSSENVFSNDIAVYIGFIYGYFINRTKESISKILSILPVEKIISFYDLYHTIYEEKVIFQCKYEYNLKMNPIRKLRSKDNKSFDLSNEIKNLFIGKTLYKKLFYYPEIESLVYKFEDTPYLIGPDTLLCSKILNDINNIPNIIFDTALNNIKINVPNNILFVVSLEKIELKDKIIEQLLNKNNCAVPFDKILIFDNEKIIFTNSQYTPVIFYLDINKIDIKEIDDNAKNRFNLV